MPYYDYKCDKCREIFEAEHGMGEKPRLSCPDCGSAEVKKVFRPVSFAMASGAHAPLESASSAGGSKSCGSCHSGVCSSCSSKG